MRISETLLNYLIKHRRLSLTGLGTFHLRGSFIPLDDPKKITFPDGVLEFELNLETPEDEELIKTIAADTGKFKALASADLDSYIMLGKQMMNISKPFIIEKIGILQRNTRNEVHFTPYQIPSHRSDSGKKTEESAEEIRFDDNYYRKSTEPATGNKKILALATAALSLGLILWLGYYFLIERKEKPVEPASTMVIAPAADTPQTSIPQVVPVPTKPVDTLTTETKTNPDVFFILIEKATKNRAQARYYDLLEWGHKVKMETTDSITFKLKIPIYAPIGDTARHRDSLSRFFGRKVLVELN